MAENFKITQEYELLAPQKQPSYTISSIEWKHIKTKVNNIQDSFDIWSIAGSILIGSAITNLITILSSDFTTEKPKYILWAATIVCFICGGFAFIFAFMQKKPKDDDKKNVIEFMEIIEQKFQSITPSSIVNSQDSLNNIIVKSARYGSDKGRWLDVKSIIEDFIKTREAEFTVNNTFFNCVGSSKDPAPNFFKKFEMLYKIDGINKSFSAGEYTIVKLY